MGKCVYCVWEWRPEAGLQPGLPLRAQEWDHEGLRARALR